MFFFDTANLLAIFIVIIISFRIGLIPLWLSFFLGLFALTPFFLNDFLFPASYMPDQFAYYSRVQQLRSFDSDFLGNFKLMLSSSMLAAIPVPFVETIKSLGFFKSINSNSFDYLVIFIKKYKRVASFIFNVLSKFFALQLSIT